jgi:hypothetical protein
MLRRADLIRAGEFITPAVINYESLPALPASKEVMT